MSNFKTEYKTQLHFLNNSLINQRMPQAIIFSGVDNSGLMETALAFIKGLHNGEIKRADFILIEPENSQIGIDKIRELQTALNYRPQFAKIKVVIINHAHTLNKLAQNCFLKTLEEPKGEAIFILITQFPELLLPTIRSRCAFLKFFSAPQLKPERPLEIEKLLHQSIVGRFVFVEKFIKSANKQEAVNFLENLVLYLRAMLIKNPLALNVRAQISAIRQTERTRMLLSTTNLNQRLALENLMLSL